jgi:hypothetical protein
MKTHESSELCPCDFVDSLRSFYSSSDARMYMLLAMTN